jgi:hypothetical protein
MEYGIALALSSKEFTMNTPVVLITGALTGIGRAPPWPSRTKARASLSPADATKSARN